MSIVKEKVGEIFSSKFCGDFVVLSYINTANVRIRFLDTGYETLTRSCQVKSGQVKDRSLPTVHGVGVIGDSYSCWDGSKIRKEYDLWSSMLARCYSPKSHKARETYIGCTVSENFKSYTYFYEWCNQQVGFSENNFELDKDLLSGVSKYYSEGTCVFLPQEINVAIIKQNKKRGDFPVGVTYHKNTGNFVAQLSTSTGRKHVGAFNNVIDAFAAYRKAKENYLVELAEKWKGSIDERAYDALISYQVSIDD